MEKMSKAAATRIIRNLALPSGWTALAAFRGALAAEGCTDRAGQDTLITGLAMAQVVLVTPVANLKSLTADDRLAALPYGDRLIHAIRVR
jgi:hypothetical protein